MKRHGPSRGFTLVEMIIAIGVLAMISTLIYASFAGLRNSKEGVSRLGDRVHEGREALRRISRELQGAYISMHRPLDLSIVAVETSFIGQRATPAARVDFNTFAHRRLDRDSRESDQAEIGYFGSRNPKNPAIVDLVRRIQAPPDAKPTEGGRVDVLATDIDLFDLAYLDAHTGEWLDSWDTTQATGQVGRLPLQVRVTLVLNGGRRKSTGRGQGTMRFATKVSIPIFEALTFAIQ
jgi:general secretion pathway protein J